MGAVGVHSMRRVASGSGTLKLDEFIPGLKTVSIGQQGWFNAHLFLLLSGMRQSRPNAWQLLHGTPN
jgi:hypothetical protein